VNTCTSGTQRGEDRAQYAVAYYKFEPGGEGGQAWLKYEIIGRSFNDAGDFEQCSKVIQKLCGSNNLEVWGAELPDAGGQRVFGGGAPNAARNFPSISKK